LYKLIGIILAAIPVVLFLRAVFFTGQSKKRSKVASEFKKQLDFLVWTILFWIGCGVAYSIWKLFLS